MIDLTEVTLSTASATLRLAPDRGGEITFFGGPDGRNALAYYDWDTPLSADSGPSYGSSELDWLSRYRAGWQFLFPNSGAESTALGIPVAFHGETSLAPVTVVRTTMDSCTIRTTARLPLELTRTIRLAPDAPTVYIEQSVTNVGSVDTPFVWGHHPTFPAVPGAHIDLPEGVGVSVEGASAGGLNPSEFVWPLARKIDGTPDDVSIVPEDPTLRLLYLRDLPAGWVALRNPPGSEVPGVGMSWDVSAYPFMWLWLQNGDPGFPWFGRAKIIGLEPQRAWPFDGLAGAVSREQAVVLTPGRTAGSWLTMTLLPPDMAAVASIDRSGRVSHA
ncbi:hypothetical protein [Microbacterium testaceum]|uniref:hypothetical protein n=1 Tax=Microbacterium testaceum TaxID=2033 RepID=UPI0012AC8B30|nr:hypothetical protein [Microbacterium testaceum]